MYWAYILIGPMWCKKNNFDIKSKTKKIYEPKNVVTILSGVWTCRISLTVLLNLIAKARGLKSGLRNKVSDQIKLAPTAFCDL